MDRFLQFFSVYARRFWPEALAFWVVSMSASVWAALQNGGFPDVALAVVEALAWFAFSLRLMQSETTFLTQGGWKARPVKAGTLASARWMFYFIVILPPLVLRAICLAITLKWTLQEWFMHGALTWILLLTTLVLGAAVLAAVGRVASGSIWTKWLAVLLGAGLCWILLVAGVLFSGHRTTRTVGGSGGSGGLDAPRGLKAFAPPTDCVIQNYLGRNNELDEPGLRLVAHLPAKVGATITEDGMIFRMTESRPTGVRLSVSIEIRGPSQQFEDWQDEAHSKVVLAVRYANGTWGWPRNYNREWKATFLAGLPIINRLEQGEILSPKIFPWVKEPWAELMDGAECYLFVPDHSVKLPPDPTLPKRSMSIGSQEMTVELPPLPENPTLLQMRTATLAAVDQMQIGAWSESSNAAYRLLDKAGSAAVPFVLECAPFARYAWRDHLRRFLTKHATAEHLPTLLKLLETDPRAAEVLIAKGWKNEALPLLRKHLENRLPLDYEGFRAMAELKDPSLAPHLAAQVLNGASNEFDSSKPPLLRDHPGIDWLALVKEGCRRSAMDDGEPNSYWLENSAPLGDRGLFRKQVGSWLRNTNGPPSKGTIGAWIAKSTWDGESAAFPGWVRENFEKLRWDDALKRWVL